MKSGTTKNKTWRSQIIAIIKNECPSMRKSMIQSYDGFLAKGMDEQEIFERILGYIEDYKTIWKTNTKE